MWPTRSIWVLGRIVETTSKNSDRKLLRIDLTMPSNRYLPHVLKACMEFHLKKRKFSNCTITALATRKIR